MAKKLIRPPIPKFYGVILKLALMVSDQIEKGTKCAKKTVKHSRKRAIHMKCIECVGGEAEPGYRSEIKRCSGYSCPLRPFRPYQ